MADNQACPHTVHMPLLEPAHLYQLLQVIADILFILADGFCQFPDAAVGPSLQPVHIFTESFYPSQDTGPFPGHNR